MGFRTFWYVTAFSISLGCSPGSGDLSDVDLESSDGAVADRARDAFGEQSIDADHRLDAAEDAMMQNDAASDGSSWDGSGWDGSSWDGSSWDGSSWDGSSWDGSGWDGSYENDAALDAPPDAPPEEIVLTSSDTLLIEARTSSVFRDGLLCFELTIGDAEGTLTPLRAGSLAVSVRPLRSDIASPATPSECGLGGVIGNQSGSTLVEVTVTDGVVTLSQRIAVTVLPTLATASSAGFTFVLNQTTSIRRIFSNGFLAPSRMAEIRGVTESGEVFAVAQLLTGQRGGTGYPALLVSIQALSVGTGQLVGRRVSDGSEVVLGAFGVGARRTPPSVMRVHLGDPTPPNLPPGLNMLVLDTNRVSDWNLSPQWVSPGCAHVFLELGHYDPVQRFAASEFTDEMTFESLVGSSVRTSDGIICWQEAPLVRWRLCAQGACGEVVFVSGNQSDVQSVSTSVSDVLFSGRQWTPGVCEGCLAMSVQARMQNGEVRDLTRAMTLRFDLGRGQPPPGGLYPRASADPNQLCFQVVAAPLTVYFRYGDASTEVRWRCPN